jgi:hypothetical protein
MRTYTACRFSSDRSSGNPLTWADASILTKMSPVFLTTMSPSSAGLSFDDSQPDLPSGGHADLPGGGQRDYLA